MEKIRKSNIERRRIRLAELKEAAKPLQEFLKKYFNDPYTEVVVSIEHADIKISRKCFDEFLGKDD